jgi:hypothetical protein
MRRAAILASLILGVGVVAGAAAEASAVALYPRHGPAAAALKKIQP